MGYPLFMKPFDGGGWRGVSRIKDEASLLQAYDDSGEMLMHLQKSVEPYDVFARALTIGPETMVMHFRPDLPMHDRYAVSHDFLSPGVGQEATTITQTVNAFFRWEFNSCEMLVQGDTVLPIDYANACPDVAVTSLHYYFPWAMRALVKWTAFCAATNRRAKLHVDPDPWYAVADDPALDYGAKLAAVPAAGRRALRQGAVPRVLRRGAARHGRAGAGLGGVGRLPADARRDDQRDLPRARAGAVPRPLPRPDRPLAHRRAHPSEHQRRLSRTSSSRRQEASVGTRPRRGASHQTRADQTRMSAYSGWLSRKLTVYGQMGCTRQPLARMSSSAAVVTLPASPRPRQRIRVRVWVTSRTSPRRT